MNKVNLVFVEKYNPFKVTLYGLFFWLFLFLLVPLKVNYQLDFWAILFIISNYFFFLLGFKAITKTKTADRNSYFINKNALKKILTILIYVAFVGFLLRILDKFYIRGASLGFSMSQNRVLLEKSGPSIVSILSAIINPFGLLPLFIYYTLNLKHKWIFILSLFLFFSASLEFLMLGSRSGLFILLVLIGLFLFYFKKIKITPIRVIFISGFLFFIGVYSINLFVERTNDFTGSRKVSIKHILTRANYNYTIEPKESTRRNIINTKNETLQAAKLGGINFAQYYLHGVYEFGYLYNKYNKNHHYGAYTFNIIAKFFNIIFRTNINLAKIQNSPPRIGIYTTFFGPVYLDFGWFSLIFMFFFGASQKIVYNQVLLGRIQYVPLLFYFLIVNFFFLVINFISGAQGLYIITSFILFTIIYLFLTGKLKIKNLNGKTQFVRFLK